MIDKMTDCRRYSIPVSKMIFTTSDQGALLLHSLFGDDKIFCDYLLKEYIYLKSFIFVARLRCATINSSSKTKKVAEEVIQETFAILNQGFINDYAGYGCNIQEMNERIAYYYAKTNLNDFNTVSAAFIDVVGNINCLYYKVPIQEVVKVSGLALTVVESTIAYCSQSGNNSNKAATGSGCLIPVLLTIILLMFFIF